MYRKAVLGLLMMAAVVATAQTVDYPVQAAKTPEASRAGIGSYHLTREGEIVVVAAFGLEGAPLADCEAKWLEDSRVMTCTMPAGGSFRAIWYEERVEFDDLVTGEHFSLHKEGPSLREVAAMEPEARPERGGWVVRGTNTWEEVERDWGHITPIFGNLLGEIELTLGISAEQRPSVDAFGN